MTWFSSGAVPVSPLLITVRTLSGRIRGSALLMRMLKYDTKATNGRAMCMDSLHQLFQFPTRMSKVLLAKNGIPGALPALFIMGLFPGACKILACLHL